MSEMNELVAVKLLLDRRKVEDVKVIDMAREIWANNYGMSRASPAEVH